eukprot:2797390-Rhodomonas_salina.1
MTQAHTRNSCCRLTESHAHEARSANRAAVPGRTALTLQGSRDMYDLACPPASSGANGMPLRARSSSTSQGFGGVRRVGPCDPWDSETVFPSHGV